MKLTEFVLPYATSRDSMIRIMPQSCIHWPEGEKDSLLEWREEVMKPRTYTLLLGDQFEDVRRSYMDHIRAWRKDKNSQKSLDRFVKSDVEELARLLKPIAKAGKLLAIMAGNHTWEFQSALTSDQLLCELLDVPFGGTVMGGFFKFESQTKRSRTRQLKFIAHHTMGSRAPRTRGGDLNALYKACLEWDADIVLGGHTHNAIIDAKKSLTFVSTSKGPVLRTRPRIGCRGGTFRKSYPEEFVNAKTPHFPPYEEEHLFPPSDLDPLLGFGVWFKRDQRAGDDIDSVRYWLIREVG